MDGLREHIDRGSLVVRSLSRFTASASGALLVRFIANTLDDFRLQVIGEPIA